MLNVAHALPDGVADQPRRRLCHKYPSGSLEGPRSETSRYPGPFGQGRIAPGPRGTRCNGDFRKTQGKVCRGGSAVTTASGKRDMEGSRTETLKALAARCIGFEQHRRDRICTGRPGAKLSPGTVVRHPPTAIEDQRRSATDLPCNRRCPASPTWRNVNRVLLQSSPMRSANFKYPGCARGFGRPSLNRDRTRPVGPWTPSSTSQRPRRRPP
jgi:hypothetical protein